MKLLVLLQVAFLGFLGPFSQGTIVGDIRRFIGHHFSLGNANRIFSS